MKFLFLVLSLFIYSESIAIQFPQNCNLVLHEQFDNNTSPFTNEVILFWYPYYTIGRTHLYLLKNDEESIGFKTRMKTASLQRGKPFLAFHLKVSELELENLNQYFLKKNESQLYQPNCSESVCNALRKNTSLFVPYGISYIPTYVTAYYASLKLLGYKRISKITWYNKTERKIFNLIGSPLFEAIAGPLGIVYFGVIEGKDKLGKALKAIFTIGTRSPQS